MFELIRRLLFLLASVMLGVAAAVCFFGTGWLSAIGVSVSGGWQMLDPSCIPNSLGQGCRVSSDQYLGRYLLGMPLTIVTWVLLRRVIPVRIPGWLPGLALLLFVVVSFIWHL